MTPRLTSILCALLVCVSFHHRHHVACDKWNGVVYAGWGASVYSTPASALSMKLITQTHANSVSIVMTWYQATINSTIIAPLNGTSNTDESVLQAIQTAHNLGLKVILKPHVDLSADPTHWRGEIGLTFHMQEQWDAWFASYNAYIMNHVVPLALKGNVEMINIGTELSVMQQVEAPWRALITQIRKVYTGELVYGCNWDLGPAGVAWWDAVDYIGVDGYHPLANHPSPSIAELDAAWPAILDTYSPAVQKYSKKLIFTEIGYESQTTTAIFPPGGGTPGPLNVTDQANAYQSFFNMAYNLDWVAGVQWWAWTTSPTEGGPCDNGFSPHNKPAEAILQKYYSNSSTILFGAISRDAIPIYGNGVLAQGWQNWSWGGNVSLVNTVHVVPGSSYSLNANLSNWGAVSLETNSPLDISASVALQFSIFGNPVSPVPLGVQFYGAFGAPTPMVPLANYVPQCSLHSSWYKVTIPLQDMFVPANNLVSRVNIALTQQQPYSFWIDNLTLL